MNTPYRSEEWTNDENGNRVKISEDLKSNNGWYIRRFNSDGENIGIPVKVIKDRLGESVAIELYDEYLKYTKKGARETAFTYMKNTEQMDEAVQDKTNGGDI